MQPSILSILAFLIVSVNADCQKSSPLDAAQETACGLHVFDQGSKWQGPESCVGEYCIYWNSEFNNGMGIAAVTTAEHAQSIAKFTEEMQLLQDDPPYFKAEIPGKGKGVIAKRKIALGEMIMVLPPTLLVSDAAYQAFGGAKKAKGNTLYSKALEKVSATAREEFQELHGLDAAMKLDKNGFTVYVGYTEESQHLGVYAQAAAINHDCRPSINYRLNDITQTTTAVREIQPGEELSVSYVDLMLPHKERRQRLRDWGFDCKCSKCTASAAAIVRSDENLSMIQFLERALDSPNSTVTGATGEQLVALYEEERLDIYLGPTYTRAALNYGLFGEKEKAVEYAKKAIAALERQYGPYAADIPSMQALRDEPEKHWSWGLRKSPSLKIPIPDDIPKPPMKEL
ncbi:hypothetical protein PspLS_08789 [Pyricularia sp. CBS 133598]|nr:hypothetical protein PspLS_08789 [Pyricularia sp. CBS 133598]